MDGTLTLAMHDFDAMRAELSLPPGIPILEALAAMDAQTAALKHKELDAMELRMAADAKPQPGAAELLDVLTARGDKVGILTRNGKEIAEVTLAACGLDHYFETTDVVSRDCCAPKPDPAGIHLLLERWGATADNTVMVGDYHFDMQAGHLAGTTSVHLDVTETYQWPEVTDVAVSSLQALQEHLK